MAPRLPRGLTKTRKGWRIRIKRHGKIFQKRFPPSTPMDVMESQLKTARTVMFAGLARVPRGTLAADVARYLEAHVQGRPAHDERQRHLELWKTALGPETWRSTITREDVARVLNGWRSDGLAADTCNKRRTALLSLYHALDGKGASNPVRETAKYRAPAPLPRGLEHARIDAALDTLPKCKTRARLRLMAYTGLRQGQVMALTPDAWDSRRNVLLVPGTAKGRGTKPYALPLSHAATEALTELDELDGWGTFTTAPMARMWKTAAANVDLPASSVPYDLRHSFGTAIYRATGDLKATKELMGHASIRMTERYTLAAVPERQQLAMRRTFRPKAKGSTGRGPRGRKSKKRR